MKLLTLKRPEIRRQKRLTNYLIVKTILEVLFVAVLAIGFYLTAFHPYFRGWVDDANAGWVRGWIVDEAAPAEAVEAQLYIDGHFIESQLANQLRPDVPDSSLTDNDRHCFFFQTPALEEGEHDARVYAVHESGDGARRTLQLIGQPFRFTTEATSAAPYFRGWVDEANAKYIKGWVIETGQQSARPEAQLFIDNSFIESQSANQPRPDVVNAKLADDARHGFYFKTPTLGAGEHEARVYVVHDKGDGHSRVLRLIDKPIHFVVGGADAGSPAQVTISTPKISSP